jgi:Acyclic terpene utilisation family protein AtuA
MLQSSAMGYGNVAEDFVREGLKLDPHIIVGQGTSSDPGPHYLGQDSVYGYVGKVNKKRDIALIVNAAVTQRIPFVLSGGSPSGSNVQLEGVLRIVNEIAREGGHRLKIAVIPGEIDKEFLLSRLHAGHRAERLVATPRLSPQLTEGEIRSSKRIVAQMGPEPIMKALAQDVDGVITGRALDIGLHMAYPLMHGFPKGNTALMSKIVECGALCAEPPLSSNVFSILRRDHFAVFPLDPRARCTVKSVYAHTFYERPDFTKEVNPGGYLDISDAVVEQLDTRTVKVSGGTWVDQPYTIKIEGVRCVGYRTITLLAVRDPTLVGQIDTFVDSVHRMVTEKFDLEGSGTLFHVKVLGKNAVLDGAEPVQVPGHELCLLVTVVAPTQELSTAICAFARGRFFFGDYAGRKSISGNVAVPLSPGDLELGASYVWSIWHALPLDDPCEPFPFKIETFPNAVHVD